MLPVGVEYITCHDGLVLADSLTCLLVAHVMLLLWLLPRIACTRLDLYHALVLADSLTCRHLDLHHVRYCLVLLDSLTCLFENACYVTAPAPAGACLWVVESYVTCQTSGMPKEYIFIYCLVLADGGAAD